MNRRDFFKKAALGTLAVHITPDKLFKPQLQKSFKVIVKYPGHENRIGYASHNGHQDGHTWYRVELVKDHSFGSIGQFDTFPSLPRRTTLWLKEGEFEII